MHKMILMRNFIPIAKPIIGNEEIQEVGKVLASGMLTQGEFVKKFEDSFSSYLNVKNSVAVSNGTVALDLTLKAIGLKPNDEVVSPAFSFIATANCILYQGLKPVFVDINPRTFNIDPEDLKEKITSNTKAVIGVHLYGQPLEISSVKEICEDYNLVFIEDCAQAHGAEYHGQKAGSFGVGCFSFYPTKNMTTGEGGMITTNDDSLASKLRLLRNHGDLGKYNHVELGYNYRMMNLQGAMGLIQLKRLDKFNEKRMKNAELFNRKINVTGITKPYKMDNVEHVYNQYAIKVNEDFSLPRGELIEYLQSKGIGTAIHYPKPIYRQPIYQKINPNWTICCNAEEVSSQVLSLPVHPSLANKDIEYISHVINSLEA
jgi:perosamine synthetase